MTSQFIAEYPDVDIAGSPEKLDVIRVSRKDSPGYIDIYVDPNDPLNNRRYIIGVFDDNMATCDSTAELRVPFDILEIDPYRYIK